MKFTYKVSDLLLLLAFLLYLLLASGLWSNFFGGTQPLDYLKYFNFKLILCVIWFLNQILLFVIFTSIVKSLTFLLLLISKWHIQIFLDAKEVSIMSSASSKNYLIKFVQHLLGLGMNPILNKTALQLYDGKIYTLREREPL